MNSLIISFPWLIAVTSKIEGWTITVKLNNLQIKSQNWWLKGTWNPCYSFTESYLTLIQLNTAQSHVGGKTLNKVSCFLTIGWPYREIQWGSCYKGFNLTLSLITLLMCKDHIHYTTYGTGWRNWPDWRNTTAQRKVRHTRRRESFS